MVDGDINLPEKRRPRRFMVDGDINLPFGVDKDINNPDCFHITLGYRALKTAIHPLQVSVSNIFLVALPGYYYFVIVLSNSGGLSPLVLSNNFLFQGNSLNSI